MFRPGADNGIPDVLEQADEDLCPETFRQIAPDSPFARADTSLHLLRTEEVSFVSRLSGVPTVRLRDLARDVAHQGTAAAGFAELDAALRSWTRRIELRPVFAAFWEDLSDLFGDAPGEDARGWANGIRDRCGLAHLDPGQRGGPIDVLVFRYRIGSLARIVELGPDVRALVPPTVLDGAFSDAFCPAPRGAVTGHTLDLSGAGTGPRREVLHPAFGFGAAHLWRVGSIDAPFDPAVLGTLRGLHLLWLRGQSSNPAYAVDTDADLL